MIIYLIDPKTGQDNNKNPVHVPDNVTSHFGAKTERITHNGITYERDISYAIMSPYGWSIINAEQRSEAS